MKRKTENNSWNANGNGRQRNLPPLVESRAKSAGAAGEVWLDNLDDIIAELEGMWDISVGEALSGGTHAFVAYADGQNGEQYVLKVDMPEDLGGEFSGSITALERADGCGYVKLYAYDRERKAWLLERLGKPLNQLGYPVFEQIRIICNVLQKTWEIPAKDAGLPDGTESVTWFREFIGETWEKLGHPCPYKVVERAFSCLKAREEAINPSEFVLLHGDAHGGNTLKELSGEGFKLIDPDGIFYEKAYDLGVLMREWVDEYEQEPLKKGKERCQYLCRLTGVSEKAIWEWGYLQTVSTAFVALQIGQEETGRKMLRVAECWAAEKAAAEPEYITELLHFMASEYGFEVRDIFPKERGFYGETWEIQGENTKYFLKIDYWSHHKESYQKSLPVVQYMTDSGLSFIPKIIRTKDGRLYSRFRQGMAAVFEYAEGGLSGEYTTAQLYGAPAKVYQLKTDGIELETENFDAGRIDTFQKLQSLPELPAEVKAALAKKEPVICRYMERLKHFSDLCKGNKENFHITHGDAGGNCILNENRIFVVDWDSVMLAPIERDAWIYICEEDEVERINSILSENGIDYVLKQNRLCYYCYDFFFYYLNEYLQSIIDAESEGKKAEIIKSLLVYLTDCWIYKRLETADAVL